MCKRRKSLYGSRQVGNNWGPVLIDHLTSTGFKNSSFDHWMYFLKQEKASIIIAHVVDNLELDPTITNIFQNKVLNRTVFWLFFVRRAERILRIANWTQQFWYSSRPIAVREKIHTGAWHGAWHDPCQTNANERRHQVNSTTLTIPVTVQ